MKLKLKKHQNYNKKVGIKMTDFEIKDSAKKFIKRNGAIGMDEFEIIKDSKKVNALNKELYESFSEEYFERNESKWYKVTEISQILCEKNKGGDINKNLNELGFIHGKKINGRIKWFPTAKGITYMRCYEFRITKKDHEIREMRFEWHESIIPILAEYFNTPTEKEVA